MKEDYEEIQPLTEVRESAKRLRKKYLRYKETEIIYRTVKLSSVL